MELEDLILSSKLPENIDFKNNIFVLDVSGDGNCWVYAFSICLKYIYNLDVEPQSIRDEISKMIFKMESLSQRKKILVFFSALMQQFKVIIVKNK